MADIRFQEWQALYLQALQEPLDSAEIAQRLQVAETAIFNRIQKLAPSPETNGEREALAQATRSLNHVRHAAAAHVSKHNSRPTSESAQFRPRDEVQD